MKYGGWALVTGSTAGIGRAFASQLAQDGFNLALLARSLEDLEQQRHELEIRHGITVRPLPYDLGASDFLSRLSRDTRDLPIGFLVNNAGAPSYHGSLFERPDDDFEHSLRVNTLVQAQLIKHFGRLMAARQRGAVIQVSSIAGHIAMPFMAEYSAGKAFQLAFGEALHYELRDHNIDCLVVSPGATKSKRVTFGMEPQAVVREALSALGHRPSLVPGRRNRWSAFKHRYLRSRRASVREMGQFQRRRLKPDREPLRISKTG